jgi:ATP-binding cassette subfamily B protein
MFRTDLASVLAAPARATATPLGLAAGVSVLRIGLTLAQPWPIALAVDTVTSGAAPAGLGDADPRLVIAGCGLALIVVSLGAGLLDMAGERLAQGAAERSGALLRQRMFEHCLALSLRWHDGQPTGELVSRLTTDVGRVLDALVALCSSALADVLLLAGSLLLLVLLDPGLALVGLTVVPVLAVLSVRQRRRVRAAHQRARSESGRLTATATDLLRNVRAVQAFGRADHASAAFRRRNDAVAGVEIGAIGVESRWIPLSEAVLAVGTGLVLVAGGWQVLAGGLSVGTLLVATAYLRQLYGPVRSLTRLSGVLAKASASASRIAAVLDADVAVTDRPGAIPVAPIRRVQLRDVGFAYEPGHPVLTAFDLDLAAGELVCLIGPSGAGKSTVLNLLLRLYDPDAGQVLIDGHDARHLQQRSLRERIAFVPQDPWLLDGTVAQNIAFGSRTATRAGVIDAGRLAHVDEFIGRLPLGWDTPLGEGGVRLSGGQRRRIALARAAVSGASLLLLDEPTAALDPASADAVLAAVVASRRGRTALIVTHDERVARIADRVVDIRDPHSALVPTRDEHPTLTLERR